MLMGQNSRDSRKGGSNKDEVSSPNLGKYMKDSG
jgi:hypothetical protein